MHASSRSILLLAGISGFLAVALGAFGAHGLKETLNTLGTQETWRTASLYHLVHSVALLALIGWSAAPAPRVRLIARMWALGLVLFSGSLYWLALGGPKLLGPVTPLGGIALLVGWALVAVTAWSQKRE